MCTHLIQMESSMSNEQAAGIDLLRDPDRNQSTAFSQTARKQKKLLGLLPPRRETLQEQIDRCLLQLSKKPNDLEQYIYLSQLFDDNETLFFALLASDPAHFLPIVYDPTVGAACLEFGHIYRKPNGLYLSIDQRGRVKEVLSNWPVKDVRFICISTGERILGLGDLGTNGMGIPIGKLQLYTACAAVPPEGLLPLLLDCGTNNDELLGDPLYLGLKQRRPSTEELDSFVQEFVDAVQELFPRCCIHFEDWKGADAIRLLARYVDKVCCYNDDIQGTGSVTVAGLYNALKISKSALKDQRVLLLGAGSAGIGIANMIVSAMKLEGLPEQDARARISLFDVHGLLDASRRDLIPEQQRYAHPHAPSKDLVDSIQSLKPTILIGVSTVAGMFTRQVVEAMASLNDRPIIFALSNPTSHAECTAAEAYEWSDGRAIYAAGVQFDPVEIGGKTYHPSQANNFYIFPAIGMAVYVTEATHVPDEIFIAAARATADQVTEEQLAKGMLFPPQSSIQIAAIRTAVASAERIFDLGLAQVERPPDVAQLIATAMYKPEYPPEE
jgi:malate dehydrogenase (oxaloacetate-decarboxylating)(NADP+)